MKRMIPSIYVPNCTEALKYYQNIFGGEVELVVPKSDNSNSIFYARLNLENDISFFIHSVGQQPAPSQGIVFILEIQDQNELITIYNKLRAEGEVQIPLEKTLRGKQNGYITDKYGITWGLMYSIPKKI